MTFRDDEGILFVKHFFFHFNGQMHRKMALDGDAWLEHYSQVAHAYHKYGGACPSRNAGAAPRRGVDHVRTCAGSNKYATAAAAAAVAVSTA